MQILQTDGYDDAGVHLSVICILIMGDRTCVPPGVVSESFTLIVLNSGLN
jgi:hypothetical protein